MKTDNKYTVPKYILTVCLAVFVLACCLAARESSKSFGEIAALLEAQTVSASLQTSGEGDLKRLYGLDASAYEGVLLETAVSGMSAEELILVAVKDKSQLPDVESAVRSRIKDREAVFRGYAPEQARLVEDARILTRGRFLFAVISAKADAYSRLFLDSL